MKILKSSFILHSEKANLLCHKVLNDFKRIVYLSLFFHFSFTYPSLCGLMAPEGYLHYD